LYQLNGLVLPKKFLDNTNDFLKNNDPIGTWMEECIIKTTNVKDKIKSSDLYNDFLTYMEKDARGVTTTIFKNQLVAAGIGNKKQKDGNYFIGLKYNMEVDEDEKNEVRNDMI
jgi:phage/plasmid-associated DNA primase